MRDRIRIAVYVFSYDILQKQDYILVFDHLNFPAAGTQIPAGGVEEGETWEAAAVREVKEETEISIDHIRSLGVQFSGDPNPGYSPHYRLFHCAVRSECYAKMDPSGTRPYGGR